ncbi:hypothetical protein [Bosea sp. 124]|uniref:hypothetical protein n=1 Tax=Bosea sp. 124 TaxID=2135642 RepID=UPI0015E6D165|nr:hypothetical protein [Bosea sp. 124]
MVVKMGLPEGKHIRLQEAVTWAFTGWSWSNATASLKEVHDIEQRDDFPASDSIYALISDIPADDVMDRDVGLFSRFDQMLSEACFRGDVAITGRRSQASPFEIIPHTYFYRARGFSYLHGDKIDDTPANPSLEVIFANRNDGDWFEAIVDRDQFLAWLTQTKAAILAIDQPPIEASAQNKMGAERLLETKDSTDKIRTAQSPDRSPAAARRKWSEIQTARESGTEAVLGFDETVKFFTDNYAINRAGAREMVKGHRMRGRPSGSR